MPEALGTSTMGNLAPGYGDASATDQPTVALVEALEEQITYLREQAALWQEEARRKDHLLAAALERLPELEAPASPERRESPVRASEESGKGTRPEQQEPSQRRSWLHRFFFGPE